MTKERVGHRSENRTQRGRRTTKGEKTICLEEDWTEIFCLFTRFITLFTTKAKKGDRSNMSEQLPTNTSFFPLWTLCSSDTNKTSLNKTSVILKPDHYFHFSKSTHFIQTLFKLTLCVCVCVTEAATKCNNNTLSFTVNCTLVHMAQLIFFIQFILSFVSCLSLSNRVQTLLCSCRLSFWDTRQEDQDNVTIYMRVCVCVCVGEDEKLMSKYQCVVVHFIILEK